MLYNFKLIDLVLRLLEMIKFHRNVQSNRAVHLLTIASLSERCIVDVQSIDGTIVNRAELLKNLQINVVHCS